MEGIVRKEGRKELEGKKEGGNKKDEIRWKKPDRMN